MPISGELWNYFYSWEPMFVDCQNFASSWEHNFVGNWFVALQCKTINDFDTRSWGRIFVRKGNPQNSRTLIPHEQ